MTPTNSSSATSNIGASFVDTGFQLAPVSQAESFTLGLVGAPLVAAAGSYCTMPNTDSSPDGYVSAFFVATSISPRTFQATSSLDGKVRTLPEASRTQTSLPDDGVALVITTLYDLVWLLGVSVDLWPVLIDRSTFSHQDRGFGTS